MGLLRNAVVVEDDSRKKPCAKVSAAAAAIAEETMGKTTGEAALCEEDSLLVIKLWLRSKLRDGLFLFVEEVGFINHDWLPPPLCIKEQLLTRVHG